MKMYRVICTLLLAIFSLPVVIAQNQESDKKVRLAVYNIDLSEYDAKSSVLGQLFMIDLLKPNVLSSIPEHLVRAYSDLEDFIVIDRINYQLIEDERERQKSEAFIDGHVVEQGKSEGIDYSMKSKYLAADNSISVRVYDVASGKVYCEAQEKLIKNKTGPEHTGYYISRLLEQLNAECFDLRHPVVRATEAKKGVAKELLLAVGKNNMVEEDNPYEIYEVVEEVVGDKKYTRDKVIGECAIVAVEGEYFSRAKVKKGGDIIGQKLEEGISLYCRNKSWK